MNFLCGVIDSRLRHHLPALHFVLFNAAQQQPHVVPGAPFVQQLLEHFHAGDHRLARVAEADDLHFLAHLQMPRSMRPVTTVPRPWIEKISSIGMMNGLSISRCGIGM